jgi:hypothetical protein
MIGQWQVLTKQVSALAQQRPEGQVPTCGFLGALKQQGIQISLWCLLPPDYLVVSLVVHLY